MRVKLLTTFAAAALLVAVAVPGTAMASVQLKAKLTGAQIVPAGNGAPKGTGRAKFALHVVKQKLCYRVRWENIGGKKGLYGDIYKGKAGQNGPEKVDVFGDVDEQGSPVSGCVRDVAKRRLRKIANNPAHYHLNLKNDQYPRFGAIRGQLRHAD